MNRHDEKLASMHKHKHSVHVIKNASGGGQRRRMKSVTKPPECKVGDQLNDIAMSRNFVKRCRPRGWGVF